MKNEKFVPLAERESKERKTATFRSSQKYLIEQEEKTQKAWEIYLCKLGLRQTWENSGISNRYTDQLTREVRRRADYLRHRGEDLSDPPEWVRNKFHL